MTLTQQLWRDDHGAILSAELVVILTLLVIGLVTGLNCLQTAIVTELEDTAAAIGSLNQSYYISGTSSGRGTWCLKAATAGSYFKDTADACDTSGIVCEHPGECAPGVPCDLLEQKPLETVPQRVIPNDCAPQQVVPMNPVPHTDTEVAPGMPE